jgi:hypothetical protein
MNDFIANYMVQPGVDIFLQETRMILFLIQNHWPVTNEGSSQ